MRVHASPFLQWFSSGVRPTNQLPHVVYRTRPRTRMCVKALCLCSAVLVMARRLNLPRFCRHLRSHESAVGVCHGQTEAAGVHERVQGGGGAAGSGERQVRADGGAGTRSHRDRAAQLGAAGGDRRRPWDTGRAHDRGARGTRAAPAREPDAAEGARHPKKSDGLLREGESVRFRFIAAEKAVFPVRVLCRTLQVSRAGFYAWQARPPAPRTRADERLGLEIAAIHAETRQRYGSPRIHAELGERGCRTGRKRVARLMRVRGLAARRRRRFRVTTQSRHPFPIATNVLARQFERTDRKSTRLNSSHITNSY